MLVSHSVLIKAFETQYPSLLQEYVFHIFKQRPAGTNLIYYSGDPKYVTKLVESGWQQISDKELEDSRADKPKKIVGKPAITAENALLNNTGV